MTGPGCHGVLHPSPLPQVFGIPALRDYELQSERERERERERPGRATDSPGFPDIAVVGAPEVHRIQLTAQVQVFAFI